jgi:hypothetical protein
MKTDNELRYDLLTLLLACMLAGVILIAIVDLIVPAGATETPKWAGSLESSFQAFQKTPCATEPLK